MGKKKLALNISKTKGNVFGTKHPLNPKPQLNLVINNVEIEKVEMTKLLGVTLDRNLSRSKQFSHLNMLNFHIIHYEM